MLVKMHYVTICLVHLVRSGNKFEGKAVEIEHEGRKGAHSPLYTFSCFRFSNKQKNKRNTKMIAKKNKALAYQSVGQYNPMTKLLYTDPRTEIDNSDISITWNY